MTRLAICGQPMRRYEKPGREGIPDWLTCGRRPGHPGRHESTLYVRARKDKSQAPTGSQVIAASLRQAREQAGLSQRHLAAVVGVSRSAVQMWERAARAPDGEHWVQLELTLGPLGVVREQVKDAATKEGQARAA
jgi:ribosome-binding protein aMBF1 (putative translation factor)